MGPMYQGTYVTTGTTTGNTTAVPWVYPYPAYQGSGVPYQGSWVPPMAVPKPADPPITPPAPIKPKTYEEEEAEWVYQALGGSKRVFERAEEVLGKMQESGTLLIPGTINDLSMVLLDLCRLTRAALIRIEVLEQEGKMEEADGIDVAQPAPA